MADIKEVVHDFVFHASHTRVRWQMDLRKTGDSRFDRVPPVVARDRLPQFDGDFRPFGSWSDEAHITSQDIPQLWQFIEVQLSHDPSENSNSRVAGRTPPGT